MNAWSLASIALAVACSTPPQPAARAQPASPAPAAIPCGPASCAADEYCDTSSHGELRGEALVDVADGMACRAAPPACRTTPGDCDCLVEHGVALSTCVGGRVGTYRLRGQVLAESCVAKRCARGTYCTVHTDGAQGFERAHGSLGFSVDCLAVPSSCADQLTCACLQANLGGTCSESRAGLEISMAPPP